MPTLSSLTYSNPMDTARRLNAWRAFYLAKGCSASKASECAYRKRHKTTWPPKGSINGR